MSTPTPDEQDPHVEAIDSTKAIQNAVRLLYAAEMVTDLALMERYEGLADSWLNVSQALA
ncbi:hypothetical protein EDD90_2784 [Streptomyces sp. Ag109_O5-1]|uniref:hypothetical protein n=1 Tax=Streptomyces sp. Ag109_O5-1 TaxID=1938851 RepID=UPI000F4F00C6|nr:hypothetical protein [Streptomyces sp. Ag109_O5-1]RPE39766.1 hypothetical protein EDD90_2784 [Streptomyces sp. Ag109_O5-1]